MKNVKTKAAQRPPAKAPPGAGAPATKVSPRAYHNPEPTPTNLTGAPMDVVKREFAKRLTKAMADKGWNQSETARRAAEHMPDGVFGRDNISHYSRAFSIPGPAHLKALSMALEMAPADLLPSRAMPSVDEKVPPLDVRDTGDGNVWLRVNQSVPWPKALKIMDILNGE